MGGSVTTLNLDYQNRAFMLGGELCAYVINDEGARVYSNAIEPWGLHLPGATEETVAAEARVVFREQNPNLPFE